MRWYARIDMGGAPAPDQIEQIAADKPVLLHLNADTDTVQVELAVDAARYDTAISKAVTKFRRMTGTQALITASVLSPPYRITVQTADAAEQNLAIVSTLGVARRLDVSAARVTQLRDTDPTFPRPLEVPGLAGDVYLTTEIDDYLTHRMRGTPAGGRPRTGDLELMDRALTRLAEYPSLSAAERRYITSAQAMTGSRHVVGKAKVLLIVYRNHTADLAPILGADERALAALDRARQIWPDLA